MFIHWGLASLGGNQELSWAMIRDTPFEPNSRKMTPNNYYAMAKDFNPANYHPDRWLKAAKDAGFTYAVLTTRHHEGFAMWPSAYGELSTKNYMGGRDLVGEYVAACRKQGLKVGFYYSPPDWYYNREYSSWGYRTRGTPESQHLDMDHKPVAYLKPRPAGFQEKYVAYVNGQLRELLTRYGKIDYLWFDGGAGPNILSLAEIHRMQPGIIVNDRAHGTGDVITAYYECKLPDERPQWVWEHCFSMIGGWGYTKSERIAPASVLLDHLALVRGWGGNVLANFGPRPDGEMPDGFYTLMADMKTWMDKNAESVKGVDGGPYPEKCNTPVTVKGKTWYAHLMVATLHSPPNNVVLTGAGQPKRASMLASGKELALKVDGDKVTIDVPKDDRSKVDDVVKIEW